MVDVPKIKLNSGLEIPAIGLGACTFDGFEADTDGMAADYDRHW